ncbi:MAG: class I SAM-dependent methyltransferase [Chloroflexota bacterium]|nr:MAG: class I SAM-dependent methyltransferase [Chloroflexota bacterium]
MGKPMDDQLLTARTTSWYDAYYLRHGRGRNDLFGNPEVLLQVLAFDASLICALRSTHLDPHTAVLLEVGCGGGAGIPNLLRLGFDPARIYGVDLLADRISEASGRFPTAHFVCGDARCLDFEEGAFDIVLESTMFVSITDHEISRAIAAEMLRVVRRDGYIVLADWRYAKPGGTSYAGLSRGRIDQLFQVGRQTRIVGVHHGALVPPLGRYLSRHGMAFVYFGLRGLLRFLCGQVTVVLRKC